MACSSKGNCSQTAIQHTIMSRLMMQNKFNWALDKTKQMFNHHNAYFSVLYLNVMYFWDYFVYFGSCSMSKLTSPTLTLSVLPKCQCLLISQSDVDLQVCWFYTWTSLLTVCLCVCFCGTCICADAVFCSLSFPYAAFCQGDDSTPSVSTSTGSALWSLEWRELMKKNAVRNTTPVELRHDRSSLQASFKETELLLDQVLIISLDVVV